MKIVKVKGTRLIFEDGSSIHTPPLFNPNRFIGMTVEELEEISGSDFKMLKSMWREPDV